MRQEKLENRVRELFEEQGFKVEQNGNRLKATNGTEIEIKVFSSQKYEVEDIEALESDEALIFVDKGLSDIQNKIPNEISIIQEECSEPDYDLPSYELIGDITVISELIDISKEDAVEGILAHHPRVETVLLKKGGLNGEFRVGDYEKLYGEEAETVHKEFGARFKVDPTKVYFSERYGTERDRVVSQIEDGERVLVMFAGVGPFAVLAARNADPEKVVAVEKNPEAAEYLRQNIELNKVEGTVEAVEGDVEEVLPDLGKFDRIIMPLPGMADEFLHLAAQSVEDDGIVHYYRFVENENWSNIEKEAEEVADRNDLDYKILDRTVCGQRGPSVDRVCLDISFTTN
jgi:tRNA (guanine37-N1)-methyltransferase